MFFGVYIALGYIRYIWGDTVSDIYGMEWRRMGEAGKRVSVLVKFSPVLLERLDGEAEKQLVTRTALILALVEVGLDRGVSVGPVGGHPKVSGRERVRGFSALSGGPLMSTKGPVGSPVKAGVAKAAKGKGGVE